MKTTMINNHELQHACPNPSGTASAALLAESFARHGTAPASLIPILQDIQAAYNYLPEDCLEDVAQALALSSATVFGVATFYAQFSLEPKGKYVIKVCDGTACHVRGSMPLYDAVRRKVKLTDGKATTPDLRFTVETVACVGACAAAPVALINDQVYGQITPEALCTIIDTLMERDGAGDD